MKFEQLRRRVMKPKRSRSQRSDIERAAMAGPWCRPIEHPSRQMSGSSRSCFCFRRTPPGGTLRRGAVFGGEFRVVLEVENGERYPVQSAFNFPVVPASEIRMKPVGVLIC